MAARENLELIELTNWKGLNTKSVPSLVDDTQLIVAQNTDFFTQYGGASKPPGMSRILSTPYTETGVAREVSWVGLYRASDLNGQILRHVLAAAGTKLHKIDGSSLTALTGTSKPITEDRTEGLFHSSAQFNDLLFIQNQDPDLVGRGNTPVKYDGAEIHRWGIVPPGSIETVRETFANQATFTQSGITAANESTTTQDGSAVKINKTSTSQVNGDLTKTITAFSIDNTIPNRGVVYIYIPRGQLANFSQGSTPAVQVFIGTDLTTNFYTFARDRGALVEGWNPIYLNFYNKTNNVPDAADDVDDSEVTVTGSPGTSALNNIRFRINSSSATQTITGVVWDKFVTFDTGAPVAAAGSGGTVFAADAVYKYKVTFVSKYGHESNAGPESRVIELATARGTISLTGVPTSSDSQVIARKLYRTVDSGEIFLFLTSIDNNSATTYTDTTNDVSLGQVSPPLEGDVSDDNTPPPQAGIVRKWKRTIFLAGLPDRPDVIVWGEDDEPESFPTLNEAQLDAKITAIYETYSGLVVETELGKWQVTGDNPDFQFDKIINQIGCVGRRAAGEARVSGWAIDREGMRLYDLNNPIKISEVIRDKFDAFDKTNIELIHSVHSKNRNAILMFIPDSSGNYTSNNFVYQYPLDQIANGWWWQLSLPSSVNPLHVAEIEDSNGTQRLYFGGDDGMIYELFADGQKNYLNASGSISAIDFQLQTDWMRLGNGGDNSNPNKPRYTGRVQPRLIEISWDGDEADWTVTVETASGPSQDSGVDSQVITFEFRSDESELRYPIPQIQAGEYVRLTFRNNQANVAGTITNARLYYRIQPGQFVKVSGDLIDIAP